MKISVIVPTLNEEDFIEGALRQLEPEALADLEIIVADGGSKDRTAAMARGLGAVVLVCPPGRGAQMDRAAEAALGDVLLFLHADTKLPDGWRKAIEKTLEDGDIVAGAFTFAIDSTGLWFRVVEFVARRRARYLGLIFGDQAIFTRKDVFVSIGGFRGLPLMEDVDCVKRLRRAGTVAILNESVSTSSRRWSSGGRLKNTLKNWFFLLLYRAGVSPSRLYEWYYR